MEGLSRFTVANRTESEGSTTSEDNTSLRIFLEKESLGHLIALFPEDVSISYFQALTEDDLEHDYNVKDDKERELLMQSITKLREEFSADEVGCNFVCVHGSSFSPLIPVIFACGFFVVLIFFFVAEFCTYGMIFWSV